MKAVVGKENLYKRMCIKTELQCDKSRACKTGNTVSDRIQIRMLRKLNGINNVIKRIKSVEDTQRGSNRCIIGVIKLPPPAPKDKQNNGTELIFKIVTQTHTHTPLSWNQRKLESTH